LTHLLLATAPALERYGGLSGRVLKQMLELPLMAKLANTFGLSPAVRALRGAANFQVASYAHWSGVLAGVACAAAMDAIASLRARRRRPPARGLMYLRCTVQGSNTKSATTLAPDMSTSTVWLW